jgi:DNA invertase Pin-like site-specific DNA recombinase
VKAKVVGYYRVSTDRQGRSGLGLEGQRTAVQAHCARMGAVVAREFTEVESGRNNDRPKLREALAYARRAKATLLVAKLDRLSRSVKFIATVLDSGADFAAADVPEANRLLLHVLAAVAESEAKAISDRTRTALQAAKARGVRLGTHNPAVPVLSEAARRKGAVAGSHSCHVRAIEAYADLRPFMLKLREQGHSLPAIASRLNDEGHRTRTDCAWTPTQVLRVLKRGPDTAFDLHQPTIECLYTGGVDCILLHEDSS